MKDDCELLPPRYFAVRFRRDCLHLDASPLNLLKQHAVTTVI